MPKGAVLMVIGFLIMVAETLSLTGVLPSGGMLTWLNLPEGRFTRITEPPLGSIVVYLIAVGVFVLGLTLSAPKDDE